MRPYTETYRRSIKADLDQRQTNCHGSGHITITVRLVVKRPRVSISKEGRVDFRDLVAFNTFDGKQRVLEAVLQVIDAAVTAFEMDHDENDLYICDVTLDYTINVPS